VEDLAEGARAHGVHGVGLEVHEDGVRDEAAAVGLVVVYVDALELEVGVASILFRCGRCRARAGGRIRGGEEEEVVAAQRTRGTEEVAAQ
jgi:hypothetical protein